MSLNKSQDLKVLYEDLFLNVPLPPYDSLNDKIWKLTYLSLFKRHKKGVKEVSTPLFKAEICLYAQFKFMAERTHNHI